MALLYTKLEVKISGNIVDDYFSFIWTDKFNTTGDFEMVLPFTNKNYNLCNINKKSDIIVTCNLSKRAMLIENMIIQISPESGKQIKISGRSYESILDRRVVADNLVFTDDTYSKNKIWNAFSTILKKTFASDGVRNIQVLNSKNNFDPDYKGYKMGNDIPDFVYVFNTGSTNYSNRTGELTFSIEDNSKGDIANANINIDATGRSFLDIIEEICQAKCFGYKLIGNSIIMYAPRVNHNTIFSFENDNLVSAEYLVSSTDYKNVAFVEGDEYKKTAKVEQDVSEGQMLLVDPDEDEKAINYRVSVQKGSPEGLERREMYIKSSKNKGENTNKKYCARLSAEGMYALTMDAKFKKQTSCEVMKNVYIDKYGSDFDVGDIVSVKLTGIYDPLDRTGNINGGVITDQMIVDQFTISHDESGLEIYPVLSWYDPDQLKISNDSDAGKEEGYDYIDATYTRKVKCYFMYNGGSHPSEGEVYQINKDNNFKQDGTWYLLPDRLNGLQVINTEDIQGVFNYQEKGNWLMTPPNPPIREHYIFKGWFMTNGEQIKGYNGSENSDTEDPDAEEDEDRLYPVGGPMLVESEHIIQARWEIEQFKITFDPGEGGFFSTGYAVNEEGKVEMMVDYGTMPNPPLPAAKRGYRYAYPNWDPIIVPVTEDATYTFQWINLGESDDERYKNEDLPSDGTTSRGKRSTGKETTEDSGEDQSSYSLVHFRSYSSRVNDGYGNPDEQNRTMSRTSDGSEQGGEFYYEQEVGNGLRMTAHWYDVSYCTSHGIHPPGNFSGARATNVGITLWKGEHPLALWRWTNVGGFWYTPEVAFTTVPEYEPYYEKQTLQWGYDHGEIQMGVLHLAPVFKPFKYYRKIRINNQDTYWLLCVPPLNWLTNWGDYYYDHQAGYDVGFCCQFYDDAGEVLSPKWVRADGQNSLKIVVNDKEYTCPTDLYYGKYQDRSYPYNEHTGANTIYPPNSQRAGYSMASSAVKRNFESSWINSGWQYRRIPNERFEADGSQLYTPNSISAAINYDGNLLINEQANISETDGYEGLWGDGQWWYNSFGLIFGPGFNGYDTYHHKTLSNYSTYTDYYWNVEDRLPKGYISEPDPDKQSGIAGIYVMGGSDEQILHKLSGQSNLMAKVIKQINNVISKSNSLSYFTYQVFLPTVAKIKKRRWYVSSDGQNWHLITGAEGNSLKVKTTDKTVAQNQAAGLTGADAIVGTNGSYYKSEVYYEDENGTEFKQTSDVGRLNIDDTDISGAGIEMDDLMNPDGTTNGIDIDDPSGTGNPVTGNMEVKEVNQDMLNRITSQYASGLSTDQIAKQNGLDEWFVDEMLKGFDGPGGNWSNVNNS